MAGLTKTLYPPILNNFTPASAIGERIKLYFSLSPYNEKTAINRLHISVRDQATNLSVINNSYGIEVIEIGGKEWFNNSENFDADKGLYVLDITDYLQQNEAGELNLGIDKLYKCQVRFDSNTGEQPENYLFDDTFLQNFSEWSSISLLKIIPVPTLDLKGFTYEDSSTNPAFNRGILPIVGNISFEENTSENLQSYQFTILDRLNSKVIYQSNLFYTAANESKNQINTQFDLQTLEEDVIALTLELKYITKGLYEKTESYDFDIIEYATPENFKKLKLGMQEDPDNGLIKLRVRNTAPMIGVLYIKRTSNLSNFKKWETIYGDIVNGFSVDFTIEDNTVNSLVVYKYIVQLQQQNYAISSPKYGRVWDIDKIQDLPDTEEGGQEWNQAPTKIMPTFYDAFLMRGDKQLKLEYNWKVTSYKINRSRTKIDTLGGRYPKFVENDNMNYKQMSVSGMISMRMDDACKFMDREPFNSDYGIEEAKIYAQNSSENWILEREFRESVLAWLNDGNPKLYRSMAEGNMVVMFSNDINFVPNVTLGRLLGEFTATVFEVADGDSLDTITSLGVYDANIAGDEAIARLVDGILTTDIGQLSNQDLTLQDGQRYHVVKSIIIPNLKETFVGDSSNFQVLEDSVRLTNLTIQFNTPPKMKTIETIDENGDTILEYLPIYGYDVELILDDDSSLKIWIGEDGYYALPANQKVKEIVFPYEGPNGESAIVDVTEGEDQKKTNVTDLSSININLNYCLEYRIAGAGDLVAKKTSLYKNLLAQENKLFVYDEDIDALVRKRFVYDDGKVSHEIQHWQGMSIEAEPYSLFDLQYYFEGEGGELLHLMIGETGWFNIIKDHNIYQLKVKGKRMVVADRAENLRDWECYAAEGDVPAEPLVNNVYTIGEDKYIYYIDRKWYPVTYEEEHGTYAAQVPVQASITYTCQVIKREF